MALRFSCQIPLSNFPTTSLKTSHPNTPLQIKPKPISPQSLKSTTTTRRKGAAQFFIKATEEKDVQSTTKDESDSKSESESESESEPVSTQQKPSNVDSLSELGSEIKKEREGKGGGGGDFWGGVAEEIKEIEWPPFGKVLGTTCVVIGVIAGSSVVLLTLNAVLAEFSDQLFAGKGVQDFFG